MRTISTIHEELAQASAKRAALWAELGQAPSASTAAAAARLTRRIEELWEELRATKARTRSGPPELIVQRAARERRIEQQLERELRQTSTLQEAA